MDQNRKTKIRIVETASVGNASHLIIGTTVLVERLSQKWEKPPPRNSAQREDAPVLSLYIQVEIHSNYVCQIFNGLNEL